MNPPCFGAHRYAKIIDTARKHGATVIGVDSVFAVSADDALMDAGANGAFLPDETLARAIESASGGVVLAFVLGTGDTAPTLPVAALFVAARATKPARFY